MSKFTLFSMLAVLLVVGVILYRAYTKGSEIVEPFDTRHILQRNLYEGRIDDIPNLKIWLKNSLSPPLQLIDIARYHPLLGTVFWVAVPRQFKSDEFNTTVYPLIISWKGNDTHTAFLATSVGLYRHVNTLPFIKNQNEMYADLFKADCDRVGVNELIGDNSTKVIRLPEMYNDILWTSNMDLRDKRTHNLPGIIGWSPESSVGSRSVLFRPAYTGQYFYPTLDETNGVTSRLVNGMESVPKKSLASNSMYFGKNVTFSEWKGQSTTQKTTTTTKNTENTENIRPTAVDGYCFLREWGFSIGSKRDWDSVLPYLPSDISRQNPQLRFSAELFDTSLYISDKDYRFYVAGAMYYGMSAKQIESEAVTKVNSAFHLEGIRKALEEVFTNVGERVNINTLVSNMGGADPMQGPLDQTVIFLAPEEVTAILQDTSYQYFPSMSNPQFECLLTNKKEFYELKQTPLTGETIAEMCPTTTFPRLKGQEIVRNYMRPETPYMSLLVYHGLGTGKTCLSIQVAETFKPMVEKTGRKVLVILSRSLEANYYKELYNFSKEQKERQLGLARGSLQCTGQTYAPDYHLTKDLQEESVINNIKKYYEIKTYDFIKKQFFRLTSGFMVGPVAQTVESARTLLRDPSFLERVQREFSDRLIIIDEIHNMRDSENEDEKVSSQILQLIVRHCGGIKLLLLTATPIYNDESEIEYLLQLLRGNQDKSFQADAPENRIVFNRAKGDFENEEQRAKFTELWRGFVSYVRGENPVSFPTKSFDRNQTYEPVWREPFRPPGKRQQYFPMPLTLATMSEYQKVLFQQSRGKSDAFDHTARIMSNIVYPSAVAADGVTYGSEGFRENFVYNAGVYTPTSVAFRQEKFFMDADVIQQFSPKIFQIWKSIYENPTELVFVYGEFIQEIIIPFCLFLEYNGFERFTGSTPGHNLLGGVRTKRAVGAPAKRYIVLHGDVNAQDRSYLVSEFNKSENKNGSNIQVIIGSRVIGEGIDLKNVRQIHIFNPWYNMSRIDQIIGRGVRHCSHLDFANDPAKRNVEIFLYAASYFDKEEPHVIPENESVDEWVFREASEKDILFQRIFKALRNIAFDCTLNRAVNHFDTDRDMSRECAYEKCTNACDKECPDAGMNVNFDTYDPAFEKRKLQAVKKGIVQALHAHRRPFTARELLNLLKSNQKVDEQDIFIIFFGLLELVKEKVVLKSGPQYVLPHAGMSSQKNKGIGKEGLLQILYGDQEQKTVPLSLLGEPSLADSLVGRNIGLNSENTYNIDVWFQSLQKRLLEINKFFETFDKRLSVLDHDRNLQKHALVLLRFFMNENKATEIMEYLSQSLRSGKNMEFYKHAFPYLAWMPQTQTWMYYDISARQLVTYSAEKRAFQTVKDQTIALSQFSRRLRETSEITLLDEMPPNKDRANTFGYIAENGGEYKFYFVPFKRGENYPQKFQTTGKYCHTFHRKELQEALTRLSLTVTGMLNSLAQPNGNSGSSSSSSNSSSSSVGHRMKTSSDHCCALQYILHYLSNLTRNSRTYTFFELNQIPLEF